MEVGKFIPSESSKITGQSHSQSQTLSNAMEHLRYHFLSTDAICAGVRVTYSLPIGAIGFFLLPQCYIC